jgi:signal transduction histidine kinase
LSADTPSIEAPAAAAPRLPLPWIGFFSNDPDHAPFGISWLRGVTPLRLLLILAISSINQVRVFAGSVAALGITPELVYTSVLSFARSLPLLVIVVNVERRTRAMPAARRVAWLTLGLAAGVAIAMVIGVTALMTHPSYSYYWARPPGAPIDPLVFQLAVNGFVYTVTWAAILAGVLCMLTRQRATERRIHEANLARIAAQRQAAEAQLRLLDAQIEPHFMFNTLASAKRLCESEPGQGRALLRDLIAYLREAAPRSRVRETTLGEEAALARSLLSIFKVRMGERLRVVFDIPEELANARIPPFMLGTLVENAIKHGIGPREAGGEVRIIARRDADGLRVEVCDDGVGFQVRSGRGVGLANVRARLATLFGSAGTLRLVRNPGGGVTAALRLPYRVGSAQSPA